jgi:hypothetical protein
LWATSRLVLWLDELVLPESDGGEPPIALTPSFPDGPCRHGGQCPVLAAVQRGLGGIVMAKRRRIGTGAVSRVAQATEIGGGGASGSPQAKEVGGGGASGASHATEIVAGGPAVPPQATEVGGGGASGSSQPKNGPATEAKRNHRV